MYSVTTIICILLSEKNCIIYILFSEIKVTDINIDSISVVKVTILRRKYKLVHFYDLKYS